MDTIYEIASYVGQVPKEYVAIAVAGIVGLACLPLMGLGSLLSGGLSENKGNRGSRTPKGRKTLS